MSERDLIGESGRLSRMRLAASEFGRDVADNIRTLKRKAGYKISSYPGWVMVVGALLFALMITFMGLFIHFHNESKKSPPENPPPPPQQPAPLAPAANGEIKKQMFVLGWDPRGPAGEKFQSLKAKIGQEPTYWNRGPGGSAVWDRCNLSKLPEESVFHHLSSVTIVDRPVDTDVFDDEIVSVSVLAHISPEKRPFVLALSPSLRYDPASHTLSARASSVEPAIVLAAHALKIVNSDESLASAKASLTVAYEKSEVDPESSAIISVNSLAYRKLLESGVVEDPNKDAPGCDEVPPPADTEIKN